MAGRLNGRIVAIERRLPPDTGAAELAYDLAWDDAARELLGTMAPDHLSLLAGAVEPDQHTRGGRLFCAVLARLIARVGAAPDCPPREATRPLALPAAVAEVEMADVSSAARIELECRACRFLVPAFGEVRPRRPDEPLPFGYGEEMRSTFPSVWHVDAPIRACPLCGGELGQHLRGLE